MTSFNEATKSIAESLVEHSSELHVAGGLVASVAALGLGIWGAIKMTREFEKKKPTTFKEKAIIVGKNLGPAVAAEAAAVVLVVAGEKEALEKAAAATISAAFAKEALENRLEAEKEVLDEKDQKKLNDATAKKELERTPIQSSRVVVTRQPDQLFYDSTTKQYFMGNMETVKDTIKTLSDYMKHEGALSLSQYCYEMGLHDAKIYEKLGWIQGIDGDLEDEVTYSSEWADDGRTCCVITFYTQPDSGYWNWYNKKCS